MTPSLPICFTKPHVHGLNSTKMMSGPIFTISHHGMRISSSRQNNPKYFPCPGMINVQILPHSGSNSISCTHPKTLQSHTLITSFSHNSKKLIEVSQILAFFYHMRMNWQSLQLHIKTEQNNISVLYDIFFSF